MDYVYTHFLREFVENSRHPKTPARGLGGSELRLLTPFPLDPRDPRDPRMSSQPAIPLQTSLKKSALRPQKVRQAPCRCFRHALWGNGRRLRAMRTQSIRHRGQKLYINKLPIHRKAAVMLQNSATQQQLRRQIVTHSNT